MTKSVCIVLLSIVIYSRVLFRVLDIPVGDWRSFVCLEAVLNLWQLCISQVAVWMSARVTLLTCALTGRCLYWRYRPCRSRANSLPGAKVPIGPWPIRSLELSFPGTFAPWNIRSPERIGLGTFVLKEYLLPGTFAPWNFRSLLVHVSDLWRLLCLYSVLCPVVYSYCWWCVTAWINVVLINTNSYSFR